MAELPSLSCVVVDADDAVRRLFEQQVGRGEEIRVRTFSAAAEALSFLETASADAAFVDLGLAGEAGFRLLEEIRRRFSVIEVVAITGRPTVETAVEAMKRGAFDYLVKPFGVAEVRIVLERLRRMHRLKAENRELAGRLQDRLHAGRLVGASPSMEEINEIVRRVSQEDCTVLIQGESGTGKELIARAIHQQSKRVAHPFVTVDCGAIPSTLIESELFGHEKGSFTGAHVRKEGLFAAADGGTLFLDEIGEVPLDLQPTLLRSIETKKIRPVGGTALLPVNVRILSATNRDLEQDVHDGRFRADLFYRLNVVSLQVPPLRERKDDIPLLVERFIRHYSEIGYRPVRGIASEAMILLMRYDWPGNVRELEHVIERAFALGRTPRIEVTDLPPAVLSSASRKGKRQGTAGRSHRTLAEIEREAILQALEEQQGDTRMAAEILGVDRSTLYRKLKQYGLEARVIGASSRARVPPPAASTNPPS